MTLGRNEAKITAMANKYGMAAVLAAELFALDDPPERWRRAVQRLFPEQIQSQKKGCPRGAFLGLCEEGCVKGIPPGRYTTSRDNKSYALSAVQLLQAGAEPTTASALWKLIMMGEKKAHNSQADVVLALWRKGLIEC